MSDVGCYVIPGWACETCETDRWYLGWGFVHGECYCGRCGTPYTLKQDGKIVSRPISLLKEEYKPVARALWKKYGRSLETYDRRTWKRWQKKLAQEENKEG